MIEAKAKFSSGTAIYRVENENGYTFVITKHLYDDGREIGRMEISPVNGWEDLEQLRKVVDYLEKWRELSDYREGR